MMEKVVGGEFDDGAASLGCGATHRDLVIE
jgi:hypothetical protein